MGGKRTWLSFQKFTDKFASRVSRQCMQQPGGCEPGVDILIKLACGVVGDVKKLDSWAVAGTGNATERAPARPIRVQPRITGLWRKKLKDVRSDLPPKQLWTKG